VLKFLSWLPGALGGGLMLTMQVGPSEAEVNFCKWIRAVGLTTEERCIAVPHLEAILWGSAALLIAITVGLLISYARHSRKPPVRRRTQRGKSAPRESISKINLSAAPILLAQEGLFPAKYIQVSVRSIGNTLGCQVMLDTVARIDDGAAAVVYDQPLNAGWSGIPDRAIDMNDGQEVRANLFSVSRHIPLEKWLLIPRTVHPDEALRVAVAPVGLYRLTVTASSKSTPPEKRTFTLRWGGSIDDVEFQEGGKSAASKPIGAQADPVKLEPLPDWPIRDLFFHINPNVLDTQPNDEAPWQTLGNSIRDAFALGQLKVWGRRALDSLAPVLGEHSVLVEIEPTYWQDGEFTYTFFHDDTNNRPQTHIWGLNKQDLLTYTDLRVNRAQAERIWAKG
jgi:hypothetical protein